MNGRGELSTLEKMAGNIWTILIARLAMILTPAFIWFAAHWLETRFEAVTREQRITQSQVDELKTSDRIAATKLQDHESRLVFGTVERQTFQSRAEATFKELDGTLDTVTQQLTGIETALTALKAVLDDRDTRDKSSGSVVR